jgi:hypothetical protein
LGLQNYSLELLRIFTIVKEWSKRAKILVQEPS